MEGLLLDSKEEELSSSVPDSVLQNLLLKVSKWPNLCIEISFLPHSLKN